MVPSVAMRVLWVRESRLLPVQSGGAIRSYHQLRETSKHHAVTLVSYYRGRERDTAYEAALAREFPGAHTTYAGPAADHGLFPYLRSRAGRSPGNIGLHVARDVQLLLAKWLDGSRFDVAVCDALSAAVNFPAHPRTPMVLFEHNVESVLLRRQAAFAVDISAAWRRLLQLEAWRMERFERRVIQQAAHVIAVSPQDAALLSAMAGHDRVTPVSTGIDLETFAPRPAVRPSRPLVMYTGLMSYLPNVDAVVHFCREIWPAIINGVPDARFRIVGRSPHRLVRELASDTVEVTGMVDSVADQLADAAVVVVPLRAGGGTRLKIYEAMAMAKPVVSTHIGAEGLDVHDGQDIILADNPTTFAAQVVRLLKDDAYRALVGNAAAGTASRFGWPVVAAEFERVLEDVVASAR